MTTPLEKAARALRWLFGTTITVRTTYTTTRPMTAAEIAAVDRAFAKFNEGFDELSKTFDHITEGRG